MSAASSARASPQAAVVARLDAPPTDSHGLASPARQHRRAASAHRVIKETLDAHVEYTSDEADGRTYHRINQYVLVEEIGRGSYGAVHLAKDQFGNEFAIKEFSKTRLRKRAQSQLLRLGPHGMPRHALTRAGRGRGPLSPQLNSLRAGERGDALFLIREEIAIMKKINHPNLVQLIEVLDDPDEDSLYMVLEMCNKGVVMAIGLDGDAEPYSDEKCRCWFRDLILGIEYLHAQGVIHRDIKPENLLLSEDNVLKVVDFGVSEMFDKTDSMVTAKSAGSPAFTAPELCGQHGEISGKAADIWSMGVSLFCLKYGRLPFVRPGVFEVYEAIKTEPPPIPAGEDANFVDLIGAILNKDPDARITMQELRCHPWVTKDGADPLLSAEENCAHPLEPPNELELNRAFTRKLNDMFCVVRAIHRFKGLLSNIRSRARELADAATARATTASTSATLIDAKTAAATTITADTSTTESTTTTKSDGDPLEQAKETDDGKADIEALVHRRRSVHEQAGRERDDKGEEAEAICDEHQEPLFLGIGTGARDDFARDEATPDVVSDSPTAVDFDIYERAYEDAIEQQMKAAGGGGGGLGRPTLYLTKFVKESERLKALGSLLEDMGASCPLTAKTDNSKDDAAADQLEQSPPREQPPQQGSSPPTAGGGKLAQLVSKMGISDSSPSQSAKTTAGG